MKKTAVPSFKQLRGTTLDTLREIKEAQLALSASSLAYTTILSIIPLLAVSFAVFQAFGGLNKLYEVIEPFVISNLARDAGEKAMEQIRVFISNVKTTTIGAAGFAGLIFTCVTMLSSAEAAINRVWKVEITRPLFQRIAMYWFFITLGPFGFSVMFAMLSSSEMQMKWPSGTGYFIISVVILSLAYKFVPNRKVHWPSAIFPALLSAACIALARFGYGIYTRQVVTYSKVYGSLGAIPIILVWIYVVWLIILTGAALGASLQKRLELK